MSGNPGNPNQHDVPPGETTEDVGSRERDSSNQQVMGAQSAKAKPPIVLNGTYGSVGPMMMDDEVRASASVLEEQRGGVELRSGGANQGPGVSSLRAAAERVMATVTAKVQEVIPPSGKAGSVSSFLGQEDAGSAGTMGSGYVTAGSDPVRELRAATAEERDLGERELFSPQQAQRLREMQQEAPLLYAGEDVERRPVSPGVQLPHSASSSSDQAEAIQAEVKRQMQSYLVVQAEMQQRIAVLVEENQVLRQVASSSEVGVEVQGSQTGRNGWLSGIRRNLMGLVQQVPGKSSSVPLAIPEGWARPPPAQSSIGANPGVPSSQHPQSVVALPIASVSTQQSAMYGLGPPQATLTPQEAQGVSGAPWSAAGMAQGWNRPLGLGLLSVPKTRGAQGVGAGGMNATQGVGAGSIGVNQSVGADGIGAAQGVGAGGVNATQGVGAGSIGVTQGVGADGIGAAQGAGAGGMNATQGLGVGATSVIPGLGAGSTGVTQGVGPGGDVEIQGAGAQFQPPQGIHGAGASEPEGAIPSRGTVPDPPRNPFEAMLSGIVQLQNVVADMAATKHGGGAGGSGGNPEVVRPGVTELVKLPAPTLEGALGFSDWLHAVKPSMSDLSDSSGECWDKVLQEARDWCNNQFVPANPINRVRLKAPASSIDRDHRFEGTASYGASDYSELSRCCEGRTVSCAH